MFLRALLLSYLVSQSYKPFWMWILKWVKYSSLDWGLILLICERTETKLFSKSLLTACYLDFWDEAWWVFIIQGQLPSLLLLFSQPFGPCVRRPSSGVFFSNFVTYTEPQIAFRTLFNPRGRLHRFRKL